MDGEISARYVCNPCLVKEIDNSQHCEKQKSRPLLKTDLESLLYCSFSSVLLLPSPACLLSVFNFEQPAVPIPKKVFFRRFLAARKTLPFFVISFVDDNDVERISMLLSIQERLSENKLLTLVQLL